MRHPPLAAQALRRPGEIVAKPDAPARYPPRDPGILGDCRCGDAAHSVTLPRSQTAPAASRCQDSMLSFPRSSRRALFRGVPTKAPGSLNSERRSAVERYLRPDPAWGKTRNGNGFGWVVDGLSGGWVRTSSAS